MSSIQIITADDLRRLRKRYGLTQKALAQKSGVSQSLISRIENKTVDPRLSTIRKIFEAIIFLQNKEGTARDVMHDSVITINALESVQKAIDLMKNNAISQLPVLKDDKIIGSIRESTLINRFSKSKNTETFFSSSVYNIMDEPFITVEPNITVDNVVDLLLKGNPAIIVLEQKKIIGIITKIDVLSPLIFKNN
ncbi:MAG: CBS domain-containing protein [Candidatus Bathyarchaeota archaeon]|nr:CBS domain-containing protein [Candidatus Bathyarchaeota archaeon]